MCARWSVVCVERVMCVSVRHVVSERCVCGHVVCEECVCGWV